MGKAGSMPAGGMTVAVSRGDVMATQEKHDYGNQLGYERVQRSAAAE
jgi:hypothetical protein